MRAATSLFALLFCLAAAAPGEAATRATEYTLQNGLRLVVIPDHRAPIVTHMVWYRVGGTDDPPGLSGLAHFFEHLMFKGTKKVPEGELSKTVARNGGQDNAFTTHDYTAFHQRIPKDRLELMMELEADRMVNLDLSEENVTTEREVVREERHLRIDNDPSASAEEQMEAALHLSNPYGRPVIGWDEEIKRIGRPEAIDYYTHHYAPNNATVVVAGDVEPADVLAMAEKTYGMMAPRAVAPRANPVEPPRLAETRLAFALPGTRLPTLLRTYRVPSYITGTKGTAESLDVLAAVLGAGQTSRLYKTLVIDKQLAVAAGASYSGTARGMAEFTVFAYPRDGVSFAQLETAMDDVIASLAAAPPAADEFERAKTGLVAADTYERDNQFQLAQDYGAALSIGLSVEDVEDWANRIKAVPAADVQHSAASYLVKTEAVTATMSPAAP